MNAQHHLRNRKITTWQENFAKFIYQETGYVPDLESLKLAMLLQKQYRVSPWNQARLHGEDVPTPLPQLPYEIDHIEIHGKPKMSVAHDPLEKLANDRVRQMQKEEPEKVRDITDWRHLKEDLGEAFRYIAAKPFTTTFVPERAPEPLPEEVAKRTERRISAAKMKAGRRKS